MKLMTKGILAAFKNQGDTSQMHPKDIKIIVKYFNPTGPGTWFCYEYNPRDKILMAFVNLIGDDFAELGPVSLTELEEFRGKFGLGIERDLYFGDHTLEEVMEFKVR